jgi:hypothetical protein
MNPSGQRAIAQVCRDRRLGKLLRRHAPARQQFLEHVGSGPRADDLFCLRQHEQNVGVTTHHGGCHVASVLL